MVTYKFYTENHLSHAHICLIVNILFPFLAFMIEDMG
jgi:hypothetical protein